MKKDLVIAIDGFSGTGKGTTAQGVAKQLGLTYLDTGSMYRCAVFQAKRLGLMDASPQDKANMVASLDINRKYNANKNIQETYLNGENVERLIRKTSAMDNMEKIVACQQVRDAMVSIQRKYGEEGGIVADGRDMGTVVYPDADLKVFLICEIETRVRRRIKQLDLQGITSNADAIHQEIETRDGIDYLGPNAVGSRAEDAIIIDTTYTTIDEQIQQVIDLLHH